MLKVGDKVVVNSPISRYTNVKGVIVKMPLFSDISGKTFDYGVRLNSGKRKIVLGFNDNEVRLA